MTYQFKFPDVGEGIHEGEIVKWHVSVGDTVKEDQVIAEIETDKAVVEIPSPKSGKILSLFGKEGDMIKVGDIVCEIDDGSGPAPKVIIESSVKEVVEEKKVEEESEEKAAEKIVDRPEEKRIPEKVSEPTHIVTGRALATPATRKLARELGVDITAITGTGSHGRITAADVQNSTSKKAEIVAAPKGEAVVTKKLTPTVSFEKYGQILKIPFRSIRRTIADNLSRSYHTAVHVTSFDNADVTELVALRQKEKIRAEKLGYKLTYLSFVIKALCGALKAHPFVNSSLDDENQTIVLKKYYNIGCAVQTQKGLLVPVIKNADKMSILDIAKEVHSLADKAREGDLKSDEMRGGSFTITNIGGIGGTHFTPIINHPECAILGTGRVEDRVVIKNGKPAIRKIMPLSLSFDHRIIDGAKAAQFMNDLIELLENPDYLMVRVI